MASSVGGTLSPSAAAVLRLIASSNLVGCWIGRSPGFSPLRMRSTYDAACRYASAVSTPWDIRPPVMPRDADGNRRLRGHASFEARHRCDLGQQPVVYRKRPSDRTALTA